MADQGARKSFKKTIKDSAIYIPGTKSLAQNFTLVTSTGLSALDSILGGGLPLGGLLLIEEDEYSFYAELLVKYFLAEGIASNHRILLADRSGDNSKLLSNIPAAVEVETTDVKNASPASEEMRIAWRYQNLKTANSNIGSKISFGHNFDLTQSLSNAALSAANVIRWKESDGCVCDKLSEILSEPKHSAIAASDNLQVCRIALPHLGPPLWNVGEVSRLLYCLRSYLRKSTAVAFVTVTSNFLTDKKQISMWCHLADICIRLESFAGTPRATNPALKDYHGLFNVKKLAAFNALAPHPRITDLAFKLRRRRLIIERLCLPPELEDMRGEEQSVLTCGSSSSKNLEF